MNRREEAKTSCVESSTSCAAYSPDIGTIDTESVQIEYIHCIHGSSAGIASSDSAKNLLPLLAGRIHNLVPCDRSCLPCKGCSASPITLISIQTVLQFIILDDGRKTQDIQQSWRLDLPLSEENNDHCLKRLWLRIRRLDTFLVLFHVSLANITCLRNIIELINLHIRSNNSL